MPRIPRQKKDFSQQKGNSTSALQDSYQMLMGIQDPNELMQAADQVVKPLVGKGISPKNYQKFANNLQKSAQKGLQGLQMYLSNYILAGSGLSTSMESVTAIASVLTEDVNTFRDMSKKQQYLKNLVESNTQFKVILL